MSNISRARRAKAGKVNTTKINTTKTGTSIIDANKYVLKGSKLKGPAIKLAQREYSAINQMEKVGESLEGIGRISREKLQKARAESKKILRKAQRDENRDIRIATQKTTGNVIRQYGITSPYFKKIIHQRAQKLITAQLSGKNVGGETKKLHDAFYIALMGNQTKATRATGSVINAATTNSEKLRKLKNEMLEH